ncbi:MAG TPA: orotate phosphoribosyltransferase [Thermoplasmata archaeon]|nr:orotate phosphoribosyltransferase [Thermoplasmata archaeon]
MSALPDAGPDIRSLLLEAGAVRFGKFVLTSGQESDVYVDIKQVWTRPERLRVLAGRLGRWVEDEALLAGMELGAVPLVVAVALETNRPYVVVRKPGRAHGTGRRYEGDVPRGAKTLVIEDVTTTGGSLVDTVEVLREAGAEVDRALTVVDREQGGRERLRTIGVELESLATLSQLRGPRS